MNYHYNNRTFSLSLTDLSLFFTYTCVYCSNPTKSKMIVTGPKNCFLNYDTFQNQTDIKANKRVIPSLIFQIFFDVNQKDFFRGGGVVKKTF